MSKKPVERGNTALALKAGFWYVASNVLLRGLAFLTIPVFARLMSRESYGEFSNYASWQATLLIITSAELYNSLGRAYYDYTDDYDGYVSSITYASIGINLLIYIIFLVAQDWVLSIVSIPSQFIHIMFFTLIFQSCKLVYLARERTLYRYRSVMTISAVSIFVPTLLAVLFVSLLPDELKLAGRVYGFYFPSALVGLVCAIVILRRNKSFNIEHCKYAFRLSLPMLVHSFTAYLLVSSNMIITKNVLGAQSAAIVSIASSTIQIMTILFQSLSSAFITWLMDNLEQKQYRKLKRNTLGYVIIIFIFSLAVILLAPEIVWILGGSKYYEATLLVPGFVVAVFLQSITSIFTIILMYDKNVFNTAISASIVAVLSIVTKLIFIKSYGLSTLPYVNIAAFGILLFINYLLVKKAGYGQTVNVKNIIIIIGLMFAALASSYLLYQHMILRYAVIVVIGIAALLFGWKKKDTLIQIFKSVRAA